MMKAPAKSSAPAKSTSTKSERNQKRPPAKSAESKPPDPAKSANVAPATKPAAYNVTQQLVVFIQHSFLCCSSAEGTKENGS